LTKETIPLARPEVWRDRRKIRSGTDFLREIEDGLRSTQLGVAEVVEPVFRKTDKAALGHQWNHRLLIKLATVFGTAAVIFAILQLAFADQIGGHSMEVAEVIAVILAFTAVGLGLRIAFQANWLVERNKAERLRMAKYRFLIDPELRNGDPAVQGRKRADLEQQVREIEATGPDAVHHWIKNDTVPHPPQPVLVLTVLPPAGSELLFARNTYRYRAKAVALTSIDSALEHATDPRSQFLGLWFSEQTLENENREWLRLML